jgi:hypothetical protein
MLTPCTNHVVFALNVTGLRNISPSFPEMSAELLCGRMSASLHAAYPHSFPGTKPPFKG